MTSNDPSSVTPIYFIHDWYTDAAADWEPQQLYFTNRHPCRFFTLPGHALAGEPQMPPRQPILDVALNRLVSAIQEESEPVSLVAHGISSIVALKVAAFLPGKLASLVLIAPAFSISGPRWLARLASKWPFPGVFLYLLWKDPNGEHLPLFQRLRRRRAALRSRWAAAYLRDLIDRTEFPAPEELSELHICLIAGDNDPLGSTPRAEELNARLARSQLIRYAHLGHSPHLEEPIILNDAIFSFLQTTSKKGWRRQWRKLRNWIKNLMGGQ